MQTFLDEYPTNHGVCVKDKHFSVNVAEINNLRYSARVMMETSSEKYIAIHMLSNLHENF